jgi:hypothetical protein
MTKLKVTRKCLKDWQRSLPKLAKTIANTQMIIQLFDLMEECRHLSLQEWNFRAILQDHIAKLLNFQRTYWKQRGTIKWVTSGDAGMKFSCECRHRVNLIPILEDDHGNPFSRHEDKAQLLWEAYKDRLSISEFSTMLFDLHSLLRAPENLQWLEDPFSKEEIDNIIMELHSDKSPGPDGFDSDFIKK